MEPFCPAHPGGWGSRGLLCRGGGTMGHRGPQCLAPGDAPRMNLKGSPSPTCIRETSTIPRSFSPMLVLSPCWRCPYGIKDAPIWLQGSIITTTVLIHSQWHRLKLAQGIGIQAPLCPALSALPVPLCHLICLSPVPSAGTSPAALMPRGCRWGQAGAEGQGVVGRV